MKKSKSKVKHVKNPLEELLNLDDILGFSKTSEKQKKNQETVLVEGQEVSLAELQEINSSAVEEKKEEKIVIEPGINYSADIIHSEEKAISRENREIEVQLQEIMTEIKKLADSSKELQMQFKEVAVEQYVVKPGKYHKNFFSWLLSIVKAARMKVEDSGAWLAAMHSKKKSKEYWAMSKKAGTSFSLSNERNVATQVG
ncbi:MAG: hypothetical protein A3B47_02600 [Candidatus Levybacteria bacterium RIFCSPLOWO2_01_FULL_39_24]|nr:MAG: hypothetical protein A2800_01890 [Candidatus Levybacteria bacterium RIFCSPHIGHO2_01_FULL_40_16]OGH28257.1 MAG: hypothetical protein A3E12_01960 [Candidatus Levybacteria bacterium RIFCSPHIGHO2_12_FULL_39_9]OGH46512.1 MAG: hypothetical protein A3B47_02600 [Candidatus Levybacteria bacterium RIFCSPLOWO2_01_FULL_39_24]